MDRATQIQRSVRDMDALEKFLKCGGIANIDEKTSTGSLIRKAMDEIIKACDPKLSEFHKTMYAEITLGAILIMRGAMTSIIQTRRPHFSATPINELRTQVWREACRTYFSASKTVLDCLTKMGVDANSGATESLREVMARLRPDMKQAATIVQNPDIVLEVEK